MISRPQRLRRSPPCGKPGVGTGPGLTIVTATPCSRAAAPYERAHDSAALLADAYGAEGASATVPATEITGTSRPRLASSSGQNAVATRTSAM